jgi:phage gp45-like
MIYGLIKSVISTASKRIKATISGRTNETLDNVPMMQQYGFQSNPLVNSECIIDRQGEIVTIIATDNSKYRVSLLTGEVMIYSKSDSTIKLNEEISMSSVKININPSGLGDVVIGGLLASNLVNSSFMALFNAHIHLGGILIDPITSDPITGPPVLPSQMTSLNLTSKTKAL